VRLLVEATRALIDAAGADRTAVRLAPNDDPQGCADRNSEAVFAAAASALDALDIAFLELRAPRGPAGKRQLVPTIRALFRGPLVVNHAYARADAELAVTAGEADAVAFGRPFIANPDLPARLARGAELAVPDAATFYSQGEAGYVDYPALG
jgi:2,4-dienoyl-CoA reductase-like NADH-dependent reductase (Old Yellow Enzyme family)